MSEKAKQSFQLNFQVTFVTLIVGDIFPLIQWKRNLMLLAAAVMFVAGWGMLENPPQPPLTVNTLLNAALLWVALMFLTLCLMAVFGLIKVGFPKTFLPFKRARVEFRESGIMVVPEDTSKSFETPWSDIKGAREYLDFVFIPMVLSSPTIHAG
ncbi:MAG TPA: hypothetical protein VN831_29070 [Bradyrhizobium sp.]|nr:hypothetical protein [Bradyrhizobium sp.]